VKSGPVNFISTRGISAPLGFADVLVAGLARDGGLYVPETWPTLDPECRKAMAYADLAKRVMGPFVTDTFAVRRALANWSMRPMASSAINWWPHWSRSGLICG